jgi:folate-binding protein YgfZ
MVLGAVAAFYSKMFGSSEFLSKKVVSDYDRLSNSAGLLELNEWSLLEICGHDRKNWLQGQVTNDVRTLNPGTSLSFCMCSNTGKLEAVVDAWEGPESLWLVCATSSAGAVKTRVEETVILEDVEIHDWTSRFRLLSIQGPFASQKLAEILKLPAPDIGIVNFGESSIWAFKSNRAGRGGWDLWIPLEATEGIELLKSSIESVGQDAYEIARIEAGIPQAEIDFSPKTLVPELGEAFESAHVSYSKGCYTGQEVLMRIHSRGHTNRTWVGFLCDRPVRVGDPVSHGSTEIGGISSQGVSPEFGPIAAGFVRNDYAFEGSELLIGLAGSQVRGVVKPMPILRTS